MLIRTPLTNQEVSDCLAYSQQLFDDEDLQVVKGASLHKDIKVMYLDENTGDIEIHLFYKDEAVLMFELELFKGYIGKPIQAYIPHITIRNDFKGLGYAKFLYKLVLDKGLTLIQFEQTFYAASLWKRLEELNIATLNYFCSKTKQLFKHPHTNFCLKILSAKIN